MPYLLHSFYEANPETIKQSSNLSFLSLSLSLAPVQLMVVPSPLTISNSLWASDSLSSFFFSFPNSHLLSLLSLSCPSSITSANFSSAHLFSLLHLTTKQQAQQHTTLETVVPSLPSSQCSISKPLLYPIHSTTSLHYHISAALAQAFVQWAPNLLLVFVCWRRNLYGIAKSLKIYACCSLRANNELIIECIILVPSIQ